MSEEDPDEDKDESPGRKRRVRQPTRNSASKRAAVHKMVEVTPWEGDDEDEAEQTHKGKHKVIHTMTQVAQHMMTTEHFDIKSNQCVRLWKPVEGTG